MNAANDCGESLRERHMAETLLGAYAEWVAAGRPKRPVSGSFDKRNNETEATAQR